MFLTVIFVSKKCQIIVSVYNQDNKILLFIAELLGMIFSMFLCCAIKRIEDMKA
jgi:hypothetical protein